MAVDGGLGRGDEAGDKMGRGNEAGDELERDNKARGWQRREVVEVVAVAGGGWWCVSRDRFLSKRVICLTDKSAI